MMGLPAHLREDRLFDFYLSVRAGEPPDPRAVEHLSECAACATRLDELRRFMDELREDADADLDRVFPSDFMSQQQQRIARRVAAVGRHARVIHFPAPAAPPAPTARRHPVLPRWTAGAAAAGLFVGVAAGLFFREVSVPVPGRSVQTQITRTERAAAPAPADDSPVAAPELLSQDANSLVAVDRDDLFLSEIEVAAGGPRTEELAAFDALTPHIREVSLLLPAR